MYFGSRRISFWLSNAFHKLLTWIQCNIYGMYWKQMFIKEKPFPQKFEKFWIKYTGKYYSEDLEALCRATEKSPFYTDRCQRNLNLNLKEKKYNFNMLFLGATTSCNAVNNCVSLGELRVSNRFDHHRSLLTYSFVRYLIFVY